MDGDINARQEVIDLLLEAETALCAARYQPLKNLREIALEACSDYMEQAEALVRYRVFGPPPSPPPATTFRKLPVVIDAFQMTVERRWDNSEWPEWLNEAWNMEGEGALCIDADDPDSALLVIHTLEGVHRITWGDWIIRGVIGELDACKPDVFAMTYEAIEPGPQP